VFGISGCGAYGDNRSLPVKGDVLRLPAVAGACAFRPRSALSLSGIGLPELFTAGQQRGGWQGPETRIEIARIQRWKNSEKTDCF
jgi:hypothetical protein